MQSRNRDKVIIYCFHCAKKELRIMLDFFYHFYFQFSSFYDWYSTTFGSKLSMFKTFVFFKFSSK